jgi:hypothetical protein
LRAEIIKKKLNDLTESKVAKMTLFDLNKTVHFDQKKCFGSK